jgi:hypothetical protein
MKNSLVLLFILGVTLFQCSIFFSDTVRAGEAGVGVINVPPKYGYIRVEQQDDFVRVYLNISDYNSWGDIQEVRVALDNYGTETAQFIFQQYQSIDSYVEINEFSEIPEGSHLLVKEKCLSEKSNEQETVNDRCDLGLRFVFQKTWFTGIHISIYDRVGSAPAEAYIDYNTEDTMRSGTNIVIPFIGGSLILGIPPFLINIIAITTALAGTIYYVKKKFYFQKRRVVYEEV